MKLPNLGMTQWKLKVDKSLAYKRVYTEDDLQNFKQAVYQSNMYDIYNLKSRMVECLFYFQTKITNIGCFFSFIIGILIIIKSISFVINLIINGAILSRIYGICSLYTFLCCCSNWMNLVRFSLLFLLYSNPLLFS